MSSLKILYPKPLHDNYFENRSITHRCEPTWSYRTYGHAYSGTKLTTFSNDGKPIINYHGDIRKNPILNANSRYGCPALDYDIYTDEFGKINKLIQFKCMTQSTEIGDVDYRQVTLQKLENQGDFQIKTTKIATDITSVEYIQTLNKKNGNYSVIRKKNGEVVSGYEMKLDLASRRFAKGFKGMFQKLVLNFATGANGCERKSLRTIGGFIFDLVRKIR